MNQEQRQNIDLNRRRLRAAFASLRGQGYIARQNFSCCGSCAGVELAEIAANRTDGRPILGCAFYDQQDAEQLEETGRVYIGFGPLWVGEQEIGADTQSVGESVAATLRRYGLTVEWSGAGAGTPAFWPT